VLRNLFTWPPPDGEALSGHARIEIAAAATEAIAQLPKWGKEAQRLAERWKLSPRQLGKMGWVVAPGPLEDHGFASLVDELRRIFKERTGMEATTSANPPFGFAPFIRFVAAVLAPIARLGPAYGKYSPRSTARLEESRLETLARQVRRARERA
jgi:hypothetical protein